MQSDTSELAESNKAVNADNIKSALLGKWDWLAFVASFFVALVVYVYTLAPTVSLEDAGELAVAGDYLGVPHPPGYPIWSILAWLFARVFSFKTYFGQPNPSWGIGMLSAFSGALASGLTAMLVCRSGRDMLASMRREGVESEPTREGVIACCGGIVGSLLFAFSPVMWSQATIVEVYTLNAFFVSLILLLAYLWMKRPSDKLLFAIAIAFGVGLTNWWPSVLLTLGPIALVILFKDLKLFRDFAIVGLVIFGMIGLNVVLGKLADQVIDPTGQPLYPWAAKLKWLNGPRTVPFWIYVIVNFATIGVAYVMLPRGKTVAITFLLVELGLLVYLYMPLASDIRNPPMNWGYPRTWEGFLHAVGRGQYEKLAPTDVFSVTFIDQIGLYMSELRAQFTLPVALAGFLPFTCWSLRLGKRRYNALLVALFLAILCVPLCLLEKTTGWLATINSMRVYMLMTAMILAMLVLGFVALVLAEGRELVEKMRDKVTAGVGERIIVVLVFIVAAVLLLGYESQLLLRVIGKSPHPNAVPLESADRMILVVLMALPIILGGGIAWLMFGKCRMGFDVSRDSQKWFIVTTVAFFFMSIIMIVGANPKGDLQDMFIQRVKFITSHAMYAFWVGYGLILGMAFLYRILFRNPLVLAGGLGCMLLLPIYAVVENGPFVENKFNSELLRAYGGASQRGHDFGWQFGNYQLRGMEAILEELAPGEEQPPLTDYPPPMDPHAVFFGGTDPGRFVPTYMIYSAEVRPDVFLITQNALADHTYMAVMRDLYGDEIWIPSAYDSAEAFKVYHDDVKSGRIPGHIDVRSGRIIVQGVEQVMAINGILCKMIHDHNKWRHAFYVEESYVIPWMYPYMEPHGLILKINAEPLPQLSPEVVKKDMEFWAWYKRRLLNNKKFLWDSVARKTFSKLRSAIAGLYEARGMVQQAEQAYLESVELCPISPEAHFRLTGLYMKMGRFQDAKGIMEQYQAQDSNNKNVPGTINNISNKINMFARKDELEALLKAGPQPVDKVIELARVYRDLGNNGGFVQVADNILSNAQVHPDALLDVAQLYMESGMPDRMAGALKAFFGRAPSGIPADRYQRIAQMYAQASMLPEASETLSQYLALRPMDVHALHELGVMYVFQKKLGEAMSCFQQAVRFAGDQARDDLVRDERLQEMRTRPEFRKLLSRM